jgi:hypothetical protein
MTDYEKLIINLLSFTHEQLEKFLQNETTLSILQPEAASELCQQEAS